MNGVICSDNPGIHIFFIKQNITTVKLVINSFHGIGDFSNPALQDFRRLAILSLSRVRGYSSSNVVEVERVNKKIIINDLVLKTTFIDGHFFWTKKSGAVNVARRLSISFRAKVAAHPLRIGQRLLY